jgi:hypothetical protein
MPELSLQHIDQISRDVSRQEITFSHLLEDLIDHICCDVEYEMQKGLDFSEAYHRVKQKMGSRRLKEIQEETLYSVDSKYRKMKNTMKMSGVAGTVMLGFAAMFKIMHWPGASILITLGALVLAFIFMPSALVVLWKETQSRKRLFLFISAFIAGGFFISGTLFKIQHWPGAGTMLSLAALFGILFFIPSLVVSSLRDQGKKAKRPVYILGSAGCVLFVAGMLFKMQHWPLATGCMVSGLLLLFILAFPWFTWLTWKEEGHVSSRFIFMVFGSLLLVLPGALINLSLQHSYQGYYYPNNNQQNALCNYLYSNNSSFVSRYHDSLSYPKLEQLHARTTRMLAIISNIQEKMVQESEGEPGKPAISAEQIRQAETGPEIIYKKLSRPFHPAPVKDFLMPGCTARQDINSAMTEYVNYLSGITSGEEMVRLEKILEPSTYLPGESTGVSEMSLMSGLHSLEIMKNGLLTAESCVLNEIAKH